VGSMWDTVGRAGKKVVEYNHWPNPVNWLIDYKTLACNQDNWIVQLEFAAAVIAEMFWTDFVPSPRELERKAITGGYRCGFYLDVNFKSPVEILWGQGTATMVAEIARPFATGLFYWWVAQVIYDALGVWQTLLFPQFLCEPPTGDIYLKNATATCPPGHTEGVPGLGELVYDRYGYNSPNEPSCTITGAAYHVGAWWIFNAGPTGMFNIKTGWFISGVAVDIEEHGDLLPFGQLFVPRERSDGDAVFIDIGAWFSADSGPSVAGSAAITSRWLVDIEPIDTPKDWPSWKRNHPEPWKDPRCAMDGEGP